MGKTRAPNPSEAEDSEKKIQLPHKVKIQSSIQSYLLKAKSSSSSKLGTFPAHAGYPLLRDLNPPIIVDHPRDPKSPPAKAGSSPQENFPVNTSNPTTASPSASVPFHHQDGEPMLTTDEVRQQEFYLTNLLEASIDKELQGRYEQVYNTHKDTQSQQWYLNLYQEYQVYLSIDSPFPITFYEHSYFAQYSQTYSLILEQLNIEGYQLIPVPATGPCLFYSLSYLLYQDLSHASSIRLKVVNYIWDNFDHAQISIHGQQVTLKSLYVQEQEEFDSYVDKTFSSSVDSSWLKNHLLNYLTNMSDHLTWGSTLEILAAAHIFTFNFNIWSASNATSTIMCNTIFNNIIKDKPTLNFLYSGNQHYDPLIVWDTNRWTSPCWPPSDLLQGSTIITPTKHKLRREQKSTTLYSVSNKTESQKNVISSNNFMNELQAILLPTYIHTDSPQLPLAVDSGHPTVQCDVPFNIDQVLTPHQLRLLENFCTLNLPFEVTVFNTDKDLSIRQHHYKQYQRYVVSFKSLFPVPQDLYQDTFIGHRYSSHLPEVLIRLANLQLRLVPVPGTGPCLFYSISMALYSNLEQADTLRKQAVLYIWNHVYDAFHINNTITTLKQFFALDQDLQPNHCTPYSEQTFLQNLHGYLKVMTNHLAEGSILELLALALLYRFNFVIWHMPNDFALDITQPDLYNYSSLFPQQPVINLAFYNNHFDPLFRWSGTAWTQEGRSLLTSIPYQEVMNRTKRKSSDPLTIESSNSDKTTSNVQTNSLNNILSDVELSTEKCKPPNSFEHIGYSICPIESPPSSIDATTFLDNLFQQIADTSNNASIQIRQETRDLIAESEHQSSASHHNLSDPTATLVGNDARKANILQPTDSCDSFTKQREGSLVTQTHLRIFHKQSTLDSVLLHEPRGKRVKEYIPNKIPQQNILLQANCKPPVITRLAKLEHQINVGVYNVGGHTKTLSAAQLVQSLFLAKNLDIFLLVDTRISSKTEASFKIRLKESLAADTSVTLYCTTPGSIQNSQLHNDVGGLAIMLSPRLAKLVVRRFFDPSNLGLAGGILIQQQCGNKLLIIITYWPTRANDHDNNTLWSRVKLYLRESNNSLNPLQYVQHLITGWVQNAHQHKWHVLIGGDFNAGYVKKEGTHHNLKQWSQELALTHTLHQVGGYLVTRPSSKADMTRGTMIEHILTSGPFDLVHAEVEQSSFARTFSDHLPLIQKFSYQTSAPIAPLLPKYVGIELKLRRPSVLKTFQQELQSYAQLPQHTSNNERAIIQSAERVEQIQAEIYKVASNLTKNAIYPKLQFWTPVMMANNYHQQFIIKLLKAIDGPNRSQVHNKLPSLITNLKAKILRLNRSDDPNATETIDTTILNIDQVTIEDWPEILRSSNNCKNVLKHHLRVLQTKLQYRTRKLQFALIGKYRLENEQLREAGSYKKLLNRIFKKYSQPIDEIVLPDKSIISDPLLVHEHLTRQLKENHSLNTQRADINWEGLLSGDIEISNIDSLRHIPVHLLTAFQQSLTKHNNSNLSNTMSTILNEPITFGMFQREVMAKAKDKSPGLSGVTINMLKTIPETLLLELYTHLNYLWINRSHPIGRVVPDSWLHRWISVIPKDKNCPIQIDRIRPISLYEVTRKIWTGILNKRIMDTWEKEKTLHSAQYGYRHNRGTETAILQIINIIEDADEFQKPFFLMGFDTKKAFDAVNKNVMKIAWIRLGIPPDIAEYITEMDIEGLTVVKSPHANNVYHNVGKAAVLSGNTSEKSAAAYVARDGIGQGDSTSATAWVALYDILLCMLDSNPHQPYMYQVNQHDCARAYAFAFADDLNTISATKPHLQFAIDIVSAFNSVTGFQSNDKLECGTNSKANVGMIVQYHDCQWKPHNIVVTYKLTIKILGVPIDLTNNWQGLEMIIQSRIQQSLLPIKYHASTCTTKALAYQMALIPSVIYATKFLNRSLLEIREILNPIQTFLRIIQKLQRSFPNDLLYISKSFGGLQLADMTMQVQKLKHRMIMRALNSNSSVSHAIQSMIARCYRQSISEPTNPLIHSEHQKSWITSYIEQQGLNNLQLVPTQETIDPLVNIYSTKGNIDLVDWISAQTETDTIRDMLYPTNRQDLVGNTNYQINPNHPLVPLLKFPQHIITTPHSLLIGRRYLTKDSKVLEFRGKLLDSAYQSNLVFRQWTPSLKSIKPKIGTKLNVGCETIQYDHSILSQLEARVYCEMETNKKGHITKSIIASIIPDNPPQIRIQAETKKQLIPSKPITKTIVDIFTDASIKYADSMSESLFDIKKIESITGGAVMMHNKQVVECISIPIPLSYITLPDSFEAEALTLLSALIHFKEYIQDANIFTDSQSLTRTVVKRPEGEYLPDHPLINTIRHVRRQCSLNITWINSHADKHKKRFDWSYLETGNIAADALTRQDFETFKKIYPNLNLKRQHKVIAVPIKEIQQAIKQHHKLLVIDHKQRAVPFKHQIKQWKETCLNNYLTKRTKQSTRKIGWKELTIQFSKKVLTQCGFKHIKRSKLIFDKYANQQYTGNKLTCPFCSEGDDTREHLLNCTHESLVQIRETTEQQIIQLPLPIEYWENAEIKHNKGQEIRNILLQSILIDDRSRLGLFTPLQVSETCTKLEEYQRSKLTIKGISRDLVDLLQITAKGLDKLIQHRNNRVYNRVKGVIKTKENQINVRRNRFQSLYLDEIAEFQIATTQVLYQFPPINCFMDSSKINDIANSEVNINGSLGTLHHYTTIGTNLIYEKFATLSMPSILWPIESYSTPLQYDSKNKNFRIQLNKPRLGEYIYYERFIYLTTYGLKLIDNNGFALILGKLNKQATPTIEAEIYIQHYVSIYQHIKTSSDLITFLNWHATKEITRHLELLFRQLLRQTDTNTSVYDILSATSKLILKQEEETEILTIVIPQKLNIKRRSSQGIEISDKIQVEEISNYSMSREKIDIGTLQDIKKQITLLLDKFNKNKLEMKSAQINASIKAEIIMLKKKVKTHMKLHTYYKNLLRKILNDFHQHVSQQKYNQFKPKVQNPTDSSKQKTITKFFRSQHTKKSTASESTYIFNSND